jgi:hypothetical protein
VREQVAYPDLRTVAGRVTKLRELGNIIFRGRIQVEPARIAKLECGKGRELLRHGSDAKDRIRGDGGFVSELAHTVRAHEHQAAVRDDAVDQPRNVVLRHELLEHRIERGE